MTNWEKLTWLTFPSSFDCYSGFQPQIWVALCLYICLTNGRLQGLWFQTNSFTFCNGTEKRADVLKKWQKNHAMRISPMVAACLGANKKLGASWLNGLEIWPALNWSVLHTLKHSLTMNLLVDGPLEWFSGLLDPSLRSHLGETRENWLHMASLPLIVQTEIPLQKCDHVFSITWWISNMNSTKLLIVHESKYDS